MSESYPPFLMRLSPKHLREWAEDNRRMVEEGGSEATKANLLRWARELIDLAEKLERQK